MSRLSLKITAWLLPMVLAVPNTALAQIVDERVRNPEQVNLQDIINILIKIIQYGMAFAAAIGAIFIVVNGYQYIFSAGNPEKIEKAKQGVTWSIGGFLLAVSSVAIVTLLEQTLGSRAKTGGRLGNTLGANGNAATILEQLSILLFFWGGGVAVLFLILGGYRYITSQGNQDATERAKQTIMYAVIGLIVVFVSVLIFRLIAETVKGG